MRMASVGVTLLVGIWLVMLTAACQEGEEEATPTRMATAAATATVTVSPTPDTASGVLSTCPSFSEGRSDATIIASGILSRESSELLFDSQEFAALSEELERVLGLIRDAYPGSASIHARDPYVAGQVILGVESPLKEALQNAVAARPDAATFVTGQATFDALNAQLGGVRGLHTEGLQEHGYLLLCLDDRVNVRPASVAYSELEGVRNASPNQLVGDGPDIDALRDGDTWYVVFRDAWGDCPMGCTEGELYYFTVTDDTVITVEPAQAAVDPKFASLARWVHGHEIVGIGVYWGQNPVTGEFVIVAPLVDSPAQRAGVRPGDVILAFNGKPASGWTEDDFRARLGGYEGTEVTLSVRHTDGSVEDIGFVRAAVLYHAAAQAERIGVELLAGTANGVVLIRPTPNFPADPTVIRWGDLLLAVNGESTAGWTSIEAADRIDSIQGEHVTITVRHIEGGIEDITVNTRSEVCPTVLAAIYKGVVYLNGNVAPVGSTVTAEQGGVDWITAITGDAGRYELAVPVGQSPPCFSPHGPISFRMGDLIANESVDWSPGPNELNLTFESAPMATSTAVAGATPDIVGTPPADQFGHRRAA